MHMLPHETFEEWEARQIRQRVATEAFWNRPWEVIEREICIPEEDLPHEYRGRHCRYFKSVNVVDLTKVRRERKRVPS